MLRFLLPLAVFGTLAGPGLFADDPDETRLLARLDRLPTPAAFDEALAYFQDRGRADELEKRYRARAAAGDGKAALVAGQFDLRAGRDAAAAALFRTAEAAAPTDPIASRLLGQALARVGQRDEAAAAFDRALSRKPSRAEAVAAAAELARLHTRSGKPELARAAWQKVEHLWPDRATRERVAQALADEGQHAEALERFTALASDEPAAARRLGFRVLAADLQARLGLRTEALAAYEACLADVAPTDFRAADLRRRLEDLFLRNEDRAGLETYYADRYARRPEDFDTLGRLAKLAADRGDVPAGRKLLAAGLEKSPKNNALRKQLTDLLEREGDDAAAAAECERLDRDAPNDPDTLTRWGRFLLRTGKADAAVGVWRRLLPATDTPATAPAVGRVADLFRQAGRTDEALVLYRRAVAAAPDDPGPREALGEFLLASGKPAEAVAVWRDLAAGPRRTAATLSRLSDLFADFNRPGDAADAAREAADLAPADFALRLKLADRLAAADRPADAAAAAATAAALAASQDEATRAFDVRLRALRTAGMLAAEAEAQRKDVSAKPSAAGWYRLARYEEEARRWPQATAALAQALAKPDDLAKDGVLLPALIASARVAETGGDLGAAADAARQLAERDPRNRADHVRRIARLETRRGRPAAALTAARQLTADAPTDPERYRFLSETAFGVGDAAAGLDALRAAARVAPNDPDTLAALAATLADQFQPAEALAMGWRAFEKAPAERKPALARKLADLAVRVNRFESLPEELDRRLGGGDAADARRTAALCLAQAYQGGGDLPAARRQLERLLPERPSDMDLIAQLSELAEQEGDLPAAVGYQRQLVRLSGAAAEGRLTSLLLRTGELEEVLGEWTRKARSSKDGVRQLEFLDNMLFFGRYADALALAAAAVRERPGDWELLYRHGVALARLGRAADAAAVFRAVLAVRLPDDALATGLPVEKGKREDADDVVIDRTEAAGKIRVVVGLVSEFSSDARSPVKELWTPADFGQARMAALAWMSVLAEQTGTAAAFYSDLQARRGPPDAADLRGWWDWWYLHLVLNDKPEMRRCYTVLGRSGLVVFDFWCLATWDPGLFRAERMGQQVEGFRRLLARKPEWATAETFQNVERGLKAAGRASEVGPLYTAYQAAAPNFLAGAERVQAAAARKDVTAAVSHLDRLAVTTKAWEDNHATLESGLPALFADRAAASKPDEAFRVLGAYLDANRRRLAAAPQAAAGVADRPAAVGAHTVAIKALQGEVTIDHPLPGRLFDAAALKLFGSAFVIARETAVLDDLLDFAAARSGAATADAADHLFAFALRWWAGDRGAALVALKQACDAAPTDADLRAEYARAAAAAGRPKDGVAALDGLTPRGADALRGREWDVLPIAAQAGDTARAKLAAERLADLRLSAEEQIELAAEFARLGQTDKARAVTDRARAGAAGNAKVLVPVMRQYVATNRAAEAAEAAFAVLRAIPAPPAPLKEDRRDEALRVLFKLGKLEPLIARAEARRKAAPKAPAVLGELAEFYRAAGRSEDELATAEQCVLLRPEDAAARFALGQRFAEAGRAAQAADHMAAAIRRQPRLFNSFGFGSATLTTFTQARQLPRLAETLAEADPRALENFATERILRELWKDPAQRPTAFKLLARLWKPGRADRDYDGVNDLLRVGYGENRWTYPGMFDLGRARLITDPVPPSLDPWEGIGATFLAFLGESGRVGKLPQTLTDLDAALVRRPDWAGGRVARAIVLKRLGRAGEAKAELSRALDRAVPETVPDTALRVLTGTVATDPTFADALAPFFAALVKKSLTADEVERVDLTVLDGYIDSARKAGKLAEARADVVGLLARMEPETRRVNFLSDGTRFTSTSGGNRGEVALRLERLGDPAAAVLGLFPGLGNLDEKYVAERFDDPRQPYFLALQMLRSDTAAAGPLAVVAGDAPRLVLGPVPIGDNELRLLSPQLDVLAQAVSPAAADRVRGRLDALAAANPRDLRYRAVAVWFRAAGGDYAAAADLAKSLPANPLDPIPDGKRPRLKQQLQAADQLFLWPVAAACLKDPAARAAGEALAARALAAADRHTDKKVARALLQEWIALDPGRAGDRWAALFDRVLPRPPAGSLPSPLTADEFDRVIGLARRAAMGGFAAPSLAATRLALAGGPPVKSDRSGFGTSEDFRTTLNALEEVWRKTGVPVTEVYDCYADIVLPPIDPARVNEDWDFERPDAPSMGGTLVALAQEAGKTDDLRARLNARLAYPRAVARTRILLARLAAATNDAGTARQQLEWGKSQAAASAVRVGGAWNLVSPFLRHPEFGKDALAILTRAAEDYRQGQSDSRDDELSLVLARSYLSLGDIPTARRHLTDYVTPADAVAANRSRNNRGIKALHAAGVWADARQWPDAWAAAGTAADLLSDDAAVNAVGLIRRLSVDVAARPPADRYALLKAWVLAPVGKPRFLAASFDPPPPIDPNRRTFGRAAAPSLNLEPAVTLSRYPLPAAFGLPEPTGLTDTFTWLVDAAAGADQLADLTAAVAALAAKKVERAAHLHLLLLLKAGRHDAATAAYAATAAELAVLEKTNVGKALNVLVARRAITAPPTRAWGGELAARTQFRGAAARRNYNPYSAPSSGLQSALTVALYEAEAGPLPDVPRDGPFVAWRTGGDARAWASAGDQLVARPGAGRLRMAAPFTGDFELAFEISGRASVSFGGYVFSAGSYRFPAPFDNDDDKGKDPTAEPWFDFFSKYVLRVRDGRVSFGTPNAENPRSWPVKPTLPFIAVDPHGDIDAVVLRGLKLTGTPAVPKVVPLIGADADWTYGPPPSRSGPTLGPAELPQERTVDPTWQVRDGVLTGRRQAAVRPLPVYYLYDPIADGEEFAYEFFHRPGHLEVHPALGDLAFVLAASGVRLHWAKPVRGPGVDLRPGETIPAPAANRRGPAAVPLRPDAWNTVRLAVRGRAVVLAVNGVDVYEHLLEHAATADVGLFYRADREEARVRNVVIRGPWTPPPADLAAARAVTATAARAWAGDETLTEDAEEVVARSKTLPAAERIRVLRAWVWPQGAAGPPRFRGAFTRGGGFVSPVGELAAAVAAGERPGAGTPPAWAALLAIAAGGDADATTAVDAVAISDPLTPEVVWAGFTAAHAAATRPGTRPAAARLLDRLIARIDEPKSPLGFHIYAARAALDPPSGRPLAAATPSGRESIFPPTQWRVQGDTIRILGGGTASTVYAAAPLSGDAEVTFELEVGPDRPPLGVLFDGSEVRLDRDGKKLLRSDVLGPPQAVDPPIVPKDGHIAGRVKLAAGRLTVAFGGRVVVDELARPAAARWFGFTAPGGKPGAVRLTGVVGGRPPASIPLLADRDADFTGLFTAWFALDDRVFGRNNEFATATRTDPRPLPKKCAVTYEFFYEPRRGAVWPVIAGTEIPPGDRKLLKSFAWNRASVALDGPVIFVSLNGRADGQRNIRPDSPRTFGLAVPADVPTGAVRHVILSGEWPLATRADEWFPGTDAK